MSYTKRPAWWLVLHTLLPSAVSLGGSFAAAVGLVGFHLLLLSQQPDLLLPHFTETVNDQLAEVYASAVLGPLDRVFDNSVLRTMSTALLWGVVGLVLYTVVDLVITWLKELRSSGKEVGMPLGSQVVYHPLQRQVVIRVLWRFFIGLLLVLVVVVLQPVVAYLLREDILFLRSTWGWEMLRHVAISLGGWLGVLHVYVVLLRLFVLRTRVFGEIIY